VPLLNDLRPDLADVIDLRHATEHDDSPVANRDDGGISCSRDADADVHAFKPRVQKVGCPSR